MSSVSAESHVICENNLIGLTLEIHNFALHLKNFNYVHMTSGKIVLHTRGLSVVYVHTYTLNIDINTNTPMTSNRIHITQTEKTKNECQSHQ